MAAKIIDGKALAVLLLEETKKQVSELKKKSIEPCLAVLLVGNNPASLLYVKKKQEACNTAGIKSLLLDFPETVSEKELLEKIFSLNSDVNVHGILVQLPLPLQLNQEKILNSVSMEKDVDGFCSANLGLLCQGKEELVSCTAKGIIKLIESTGINLEGKNVCIVNHSIVVGKPLAILLLNRNSTVSVCHKFTKNLGVLTCNADILVSAAGVPGLIKKDFVKQGAIVIDAGISKQDGKTLGDIDFDSAKEKAAFITPVPGGVGPMTVACLLDNTIIACKKQVGEKQ